MMIFVFIQMSKKNEQKRLRQILELTGLRRKRNQHKNFPLEFLATITIDNAAFLSWAQ